MLKCWPLKLEESVLQLRMKSGNDLNCLFSCLQAISQYTEALGSSDDDDSCLVNRGIAYTMLGEMDNAMEDFNKACKLFTMSMISKSLP